PPVSKATPRSHRRARSRRGGRHSRYDHRGGGTAERGMAAESAGILMYKYNGQDILVLLVHPGGPYWRHKDRGAWSIPKGERSPGEDAETAARREFTEELGTTPAGLLSPLGRVRQRAGKQVEAFAVEGGFDVDHLSSNTFEM